MGLSQPESCLIFISLRTIQYRSLLAKSLLFGNEKEKPVPTPPLVRSSIGNIETASKNVHTEY